MASGQALENVQPQHASVPCTLVLQLELNDQCWLLGDLRSAQIEVQYATRDSVVHDDNHCDTVGTQNLLRYYHR